MRASAPRPADGGLPPAARVEAGFTLMELMVVCVIVGAALMLVPANFGSFGARGRLSSAANTLLAQLTATKEQATRDGYEARLELGWFLQGGSDDLRPGVRYWYTNVPAKGTQKLTDDADSGKQRATSRAEERQWLSSRWQSLPDGVIVSGISVEAGQWEKLAEGEKTFQVRYLPDGSVDRGFAVRLESTDLDVKQEFRTITVVVNPLTAESASYDGFRELPRQRDAGEFR